jgi:Glycosyltransferase family 87
MIFPLGVLSFGSAYVAWDVFTFSIYFLVSYYRRWRRSAILVTIFTPAALLNFNTGETGFLSAALILGGFRFVANRPILSGVAFGLASFKPQLGILIPIALISARAWRPLAAAGATVAALVAVSSLVFGWSIWPIWLGKLLAHAEWAAEVPNRLKPTITANLTFLGVDPAIPRMVQIAAAVVVAIIVWFCFRRGVILLATAALLVGTFLATPYALYYDLVILTNVVLMVILHKDQTNRSLTLPEAIILLLSLFLPTIMMNTWRSAMFRSIPLFLLFGLIVRDLLRFHSDAEQRGSAPAARAASPL